MVVVLAELGVAVTPVMEAVEIAKMVDGVEVALVLVQVIATEVVLGRRVHGSRRLVTVGGAAAGDVAT